MRFSLANVLAVSLAASAVALSGCATTQSGSSGSLVPAAHALVPLSGPATSGGGTSGGGGASGGGGGGGGNVTLNAIIVADAGFPNVRGSLVYSQVGSFEKLTGDLVDTGVVQPPPPAIPMDAGLFINGTLVNWASIAPTNGIPLEFAAICPDVTATSTDCAGFAGEFAHAPGGGTPAQTVPVLKAGAVVDVELFTGVLGRSIFATNGRTNVQHIGTAILR